LGHSQFVHVRCATIVVELLFPSVGSLVSVLCAFCGEEILDHGAHLLTGRAPIGGSLPEGGV
jgi:hypothetical protein